MQQMMQGMVGPPPGDDDELVKVSVSHMMDEDGNIVVQEHVIPAGEEEEDDDDIPNELREMLQLTEHIHSKSKSGPFRLPKSEKKRQDESKEDILRRLNDLHEEIEERRDKEKYADKEEQQGSRKWQMLLASTAFVILALAGFILTCQKNKKIKEVEEGENCPPVNKEKVRIGHSD